ncbi:amidohydrolase family protein [Mycobacterium xenopi]|uniref:amidohydrolase family protein n=1 Tax=Mycobacterium xenopi TaxID=1789 RepID=UPI0022EA9066|nr:amidohydrolase family protein [Mycobacterium xenopi]MDA3656206.1 amidohydrolase family protein [Mycobacterium xenopi]
MARVVDSDQHLYESRSLWADHIDPSARDEALSLVDDERGYTWLSWRGFPLALADVHVPGDTASCGDHRNRCRAGKPPAYRYDEALPASYWRPEARVRWLDEVGLDEAVVFPNYGLLWERRLSSSRPAVTANMTAWNRGCAAVQADGRGRLHPVAHLTLRDPEWLEAELARLAGAGVRLAMIGAGSVEGRALSHPDHDRIWSAFVEHGITPVFHVADQVRIFDDCWYPDDQSGDLVPATEAVFLWVPPALALTDLILHGVFDRHPRLRFGVVELSSAWVPQFLLLLDGASDFTTRLNGKPVAQLSRRPSEYFLEHVRVSSFSYEDPKQLTEKTGDVFMFCSDYPHSEGTSTPLDDYRRMGCEEPAMPGLFHDNVDALLRH